MIPDHASKSPGELRRQLFRERMRQLHPKERMAQMACEANARAEEAAREVFESIELPENDVVEMTLEIWNQMAVTLGSYDSTYPTGQRLGKRWCREMRFTGENGVKRYIGEYRASSQWPEFIGVHWYPVRIVVDHE